MTATFPALALFYSFSHAYFYSGSAKTPTLGTLPAAFIALGFVVIMLPLVMLVANDQRWAVTSARAVSLAVQIVSGLLGGFLLILSVGYLLHAIGLDPPGFDFSGPARLEGVLVLLIALAVIAPAFAASTVARARLGTISGQ